MANAVVTWSAPPDGQAARPPALPRGEATARRAASPARTGDRRALRPSPSVDLGRRPPGGCRFAGRGSPRVGRGGGSRRGRLRDGDRGQSGTERRECCPATALRSPARRSVPRARARRTASTSSSERSLAAAAAADRELLADPRSPLRGDRGRKGRAARASVRSARVPCPALACGRSMSEPSARQLARSHRSSSEVTNSGLPPVRSRSSREMSGDASEPSRASTYSATASPLRGPTAISVLRPRCRSRVRRWTG